MQEAEAAGKDLEDEAYGGLLLSSLKATLSEEVNGLGATAAAARLSSRAGRPKPRHARKMVRSSCACLAVTQVDDTAN